MSTYVLSTALGRPWNPKWTLPSGSSLSSESEIWRHTLLRAGVAGPVIYSWQDRSNKGIPSFARDRDWLGRHLQKSKI